MAGREITYIDDWSPVPASLHREAQVEERDWWQHQDRNILQLTAKYHFYAGYYDWTRHRRLLNPFCIRPDGPSNFQISNDAIAGKRMLDLGCGPISESISLVHCAEVHAIYPLMEFYQQLQPFGWDFYCSAIGARAEQLPFATGSFDYVYCRNM